MPHYHGAFQSTTLGRTIRLLSGDRLFKYQDEVHVPQQYTKARIDDIKIRERSARDVERSPRRNDSDDATLRGDEPGPDSATREKRGGGTQSEETEESEARDQDDSARQAPNTATNAASKEAGPKTQSEVEEGQDPNLVTWYGPDDPENPYVPRSRYAILS